MEQPGTSHCRDGACWLRAQAFVNPAPMDHSGPMDSVLNLLGRLEEGLA